MVVCSSGVCLALGGYVLQWQSDRGSFASTVGGTGLRCSLRNGPIVRGFLDVLGSLVSWEGGGLCLVV